MTSLFAISEDPTVDPTNPRRRQRLPVEVPAGVSAEGAGLMPSALVRGFPLRSPFLAEEATPLRMLSKFRDVDYLPFREKTLGEHKPLGPITIDRTRLLNLEGQILVFEFDVPVDGFMLPDKKTEIHVLFDDSGDSCEARVLKRESSKTGPHQAGITVRLALQLKGDLWRHHREARIHWDGMIRHERKKYRVQMELHLLLTGVM